jgi:hypothetical protein
MAAVNPDVRAPAIYFGSHAYGKLCIIEFEFHDESKDGIMGQEEHDSSDQSYSMLPEWVSRLAEAPPCTLHRHLASDT